MLCDLENKKHNHVLLTEVIQASENLLLILISRILKTLIVLLSLCEVDWELNQTQSTWM